MKIGNTTDICLLEGGGIVHTTSRRTRENRGIERRIGGEVEAGREREVTAGIGRSNPFISYCSLVPLCFL